MTSIILGLNQWKCSILLRVSSPNWRLGSDEEASESGDDGDSESSDDDGGGGGQKGRQPKSLSKYEKKKRKRIRKDLKRMRRAQDDEAGEGPSTSAATVEERKQRAAAISASRILTDKDFSRIDAAQVRKQVQGLKASKRQAIQMEESDGLVKRFVSSSIPFFF